MREQNANRVNLLLPGSLHWQPQQVESPVNRWRDWAQTLSERRGRIALRHSGLSLIFAQPQTMVFSRIERWRQAALTFSQQINLAINQILRQTDRHESPAPFAAQSQTIFALPASTTDERGMVRRRSNDGRAMDGRSAGAREGFSDLQPPLKRVFARAGAEEASAAMMVSRLRQETLLVQRSLQFSQRVVDERRRTEEQARRSLVIRQQRDAPKTTAGAAQEETVFQSPLGSRAGATGMNQFAPLPIDIERLTDQVAQNIDRRIVAHRERMGRVF